MFSTYPDMDGLYPASAEFSALPSNTMYTEEAVVAQAGFENDDFRKLMSPEVGETDAEDMMIWFGVPAGTHLSEYFIGG